MGDVGAGGGADQAGHAGIAEQVQHPHAGAGEGALAQPGPVGRLFRKKGQVAKAGEAGGEGHVAPSQRPFLARLPLEAPASGFFLVSGIEHRVGVVPRRRVQARRPQALGLGAHDAIGPVTLQLAAIAAVDQGVVVPGGGSRHHGVRRQKGCVRAHPFGIRGAGACGKAEAAICACASPWRGRPRRRETRRVCPSNDRPGPPCPWRLCDERRPRASRADAPRGWA